MPEGDTIFRAAQTLHRALAGRVVERFESVLPQLMRVDHDHPVAGRTVDAVSARGKHLLMTFSGDLVLHTHMRMNGAWHLYRPGVRWQKPVRDMRVILSTAHVVAVAFNITVAEFLSAGDLRRHRDLRALGPDLLDPAFDPGEAKRRMRANPRTAIGDALLNQRIMAGIGNVLKSEILFVTGIEPFSPVGSLSDEALDRIVSAAHDLIGVNARTAPRGPFATYGRRTTRSLDPSVKLWVYGRGGLPCRKCGALIQSKKTGVDARLTYWCPRCQAGRLRPT
jgi:endonuclease-8